MWLIAKQLMLLKIKAAEVVKFVTTCILDMGLNFNSFCNVYHDFKMLYPTLSDAAIITGKGVGYR